MRHKEGSLRSIFEKEREQLENLKSRAGYLHLKQGSNTERIFTHDNVAMIGKIPAEFYAIIRGSDGVYELKQFAISFPIRDLRELGQTMEALNTFFMLSHPAEGFEDILSDSLIKFVKEQELDSENNKD